MVWNRAKKRAWLSSKGNFAYDNDFTVGFRIIVNVSTDYVSFEMSLFDDMPNG